MWCFSKAKSKKCSVSQKLKCHEYAYIPYGTFWPSNTDTRTHLLVTASLAKELVCLPRRPEWYLLDPDWFGWKHMAIAELATLVTEVKCAISQSQGQSWLFFCSPLVHSASPERWELRAERRGCCSKVMMLCRKKWMLRQKQQMSNTCRKKLEPGRRGH